MSFELKDKVVLISHPVVVCKQTLQKEIWEYDDKLDVIYRIWRVRATKARKLNAQIDRARHGIPMTSFLTSTESKANLPVKEANDIQKMNITTPHPRPKKQFAEFCGRPLLCLLKNDLV